MSALALLLVCLALGMGVTRWARPPEGLATCINWWLMNIALPALVLELIPRAHFNTQLWFLTVGMLVVFAGAWGLFGWLGPRLGWSRGQTGAVILTAGLGNTSFMGFPMMEALRGQEALAYAAIVDLTGSFISLSVGGVIVSAIYSGQPVNVGGIVRRVVLFPPFVAMLVAVGVAAAGGWPPTLESMFERIGSTLVPLALFSVGLQFRLVFSREYLSALGLSLGWKMVLAPLACLLLALATGVHGLVRVVGVLQAAAAPMVSSVIFAERANLEPRLAAMILGIGVLIALVTIPLANALL